MAEQKDARRTIPDMKAILVVTCLVLAIDATHGCTCERMSKRKKFCNADFAMEAFIDSKLRDPNRQQDFDDFYDIRVNSVVKMNNRTAVDMTRVYTASHSGFCGAQLKKGLAYFIAGDIEKDRLSINMCQSLYVRVSPGGVKTKRFDNVDCR